MSEPLKGANPTAALTTRTFGEERILMAASQPNCALPPFPECPGVQFAHVPDWPGYAVSDDGRIFTCKRRGRGKGYYDAWCEMSLFSGRGGYLRATVINGAKKRKISMNGAVLCAFVSERPEGLLALHKDGDPKNNRLSNLYWGTHQQNMRDRFVHGRSGEGERNSSSMLTAAQVIHIRLLRHAGLKPHEIAKIMSCSESAVGKIVNNKTWVHLLDEKNAPAQSTTTTHTRMRLANQ